MSWDKERDEDLKIKLAAAVAVFNAFAPEQKAEHMAAQRKSWVVGELMIEHPEMSREEAEQIYASVQRGELL